MFPQVDQPRCALILDFDGVVVATEELHYECWNAAFDELLDLHIEGDHRQLVGLSLDEIYALWCRRGDEQSTDLDPDTRRNLLSRKTELFFERGRGRLTPMPGLMPLIRRAHAAGWYVAIASRSLRMRLLRTLELVRLPAIFDLVMGYEDCVDPATDRKLHVRAAIPFGVAPARCLVIEDSASGVQDARQCGVGRVIGLTTSLDHARLKAAGAHATVDYLDEVELVRAVKDSV